MHQTLIAPVEGDMNRRTVVPGHHIKGVAVKFALVRVILEEAVRQGFCVLV